MRDLSNAIRFSLTNAFAPIALEVTDESQAHAGHSGARPGGQTHFHVRIVSSSFTGLSRVERHRQIYAVLAAEFDAGMHALRVTALSPDEPSRA